jgi:enoyl-CoA hydratase/carnithine racemase
MFSQQSLVLDVADFNDPTADRLAALLSGRAEQPSKARELRSGVVVSFEKLGVNNPAADPRARRFLQRAAQRFAGIGYFLHGDPPTYHLRDISSALAFAEAEGRQPMGDDFVRVHQRLLMDALEFAKTVADDAPSLDEVYLVNLLPMVMPAEVRKRAMRALLPALLMSREGERIRRRCTKEAEALWGRKLAEFPDFEAFVAAFQQATRAAG